MNGSSIRPQNVSHFWNHSMSFNLDIGHELRPIDAVRSDVIRALLSSEQFTVGENDNTAPNTTADGELHAV